MSYGNIGGKLNQTFMKLRLNCMKVLAPLSTIEQHDTLIIVKIILQTIDVKRNYHEN